MQRAGLYQLVSLMTCCEIDSTPSTLNIAQHLENALLASVLAALYQTAYYTFFSTFPRTVEFRRDSPRAKI